MTRLAVGIGHGDFSAPEPPPLDEHPNEPEGMTVLLDRAFNALDETDDAGVTWVDGNGGPGTFEAYQTAAIETTHTDAPHSPNNVAAVRFPAGHGGSSSSATARLAAGFPDFTTQGQRIYMAWWWKISDNWFGHTGGQNKIFYLGSPIIIEFGFESDRGGVGDDPYFNWTFATQGGETVNFRCTHDDNEVSPSLEEAQILRDTWYHNEVLVTCNTPNVANGSFQFWQNGVELMRFTGNRNILGSGSYDSIDGLDWHPIYGGGNTNTIDEDQYQYMDHIYVSGSY